MAARRDSYEAQHLRNLAQYRKELEALFAEMCKKAGMTAEAARPFIKNALDGAELVKLPAFKSEMDKIITRFAKRLKTQINKQSEAEWKLANEKYDALVRQMAGNLWDDIAEERKNGLINHNEAALRAFMERKEKGLGLSDKVWRYSNQFREQIELGLQIGIAEGQSASEMARELKSYLQYPDKLFRKVKDKETGKYHLSSSAAAFHPGAGVYRSSYQNAFRLARTENNMAYRKADSIRRKQLDFVVGVEIHLSNNHNCKGVPEGEFYDICDELAGKYPADFDFVGWHPNCRCWTSSILQTEEEFLRDMDGVYRGSVNEVKEVPRQFKGWLKRNKDRIERAEQRGTLPYFLRDNRKYFKDIDNEKNDIVNNRLSDISAKVRKITQQHSGLLLGTIDPFSAVIAQMLSRNNHLKNQLAIFNEIMNDSRAEEHYKSSNTGARTIIFPGHKIKNHTWKDTLKIAVLLNNAGKSVAFLPEYSNDTSSDSMTVFMGRPIVADFKYLITKKPNTLALDLEQGFTQAGTIVVQMPNIDAGNFREGIEQLQRKIKKGNATCSRIGNMILMSEYGSIVEISSKHFKTGEYIKKIKGFF